jgi:hypothetical protein
MHPIPSGFQSGHHFAVSPRTQVDFKVRLTAVEAIAMLDARPRKPHERLAAKRQTQKQSLVACLGDDGYGHFHLKSSSTIASLENRFVSRHRLFQQVENTPIGHLLRSNEQDSPASHGSGIKLFVFTQ